MALMALDYVVNNTADDIYAEVYHIQGGDHAFLIIGKKIKNANKKDEAYEDIYFCDPWSNAVYSKDEYLSKLKNYVSKGNRKKGEYTNCTEDFVPKKHSLARVPKMNSAFIKKSISMEHLLELEELFNKKKKVVIESIAQLINKLENLANEIEKQHG